MIVEDIMQYFYFIDILVFSRVTPSNDTSFSQHPLSEDDTLSNDSADMTASTVIQLSTTHDSNLHDVTVDSETKEQLNNISLHEKMSTSRPVLPIHKNQSPVKETGITDVDFTLKEKEQLAEQTKRYELQRDLLSSASQGSEKSSSLDVSESSAPMTSRILQQQEELKAKIRSIEKQKELLRYTMANSTGTEMLDLNRKCEIFTICLE